jgi:protein-disulfide isomerase
MTMARLMLPVSERDHVLGPKDARVTLLEYGDFECPHCGAAHPVLKELMESLGDRVRFVFRNFPLSQLHARAERAAMAVESAGLQGTFWEMHDLLFENQDALEEEDFRRHAETLGLDLDAFAAGMEDVERLNHVREDFVSGVRGGVNGTPTFFINGVRHDGSAASPRQALTRASQAA